MIPTSASHVSMSVPLYVCLSLSLSLFVCLCLCLSVLLSLLMSIYLCLSVSSCYCMSLFMSVSVCLFHCTSLPVCLSIYLWNSNSLFMSLCLCLWIASIVVYPSPELSILPPNVPSTCLSYLAYLDFGLHCLCLIDKLICLLCVLQSVCSNAILVQLPRPHLHRLRHARPKRLRLPCTSYEIIPNWEKAGRKRKGRIMCSQNSMGVFWRFTGSIPPSESVPVIKACCYYYFTVFQSEENPLLTAIPFSFNFNLVPSPPSFTFSCSFPATVTL